MRCPVTTFECVTCGGNECDLSKKLGGHARRDPTVCPGREDHYFSGWREFEDGRGGEQICTHCGVGAMAYTLACDF